MTEYLKYLVLILVLIVSYQFYKYSISTNGVQRQKRCQPLGIFFTTLGIVGLVFRTPPFVIGGLIFLMLGLRLIAHGLDRVDKKIHIDHLDDDDE